MAAVVLGVIGPQYEVRAQEAGGEVADLICSGQAKDGGWHAVRGMVCKDSVMVNDRRGGQATGGGEANNRRRV